MARQVICTINSLYIFIALNIGKCSVAYLVKRLNLSHFRHFRFGMELERQEVSPQAFGLTFLPAPPGAGFFSAALAFAAAVP
jgi:hypothetical protein